MFSCCFWWFLLGAVVGWLLNWLLCKVFNCCGAKTSTSTQNVATKDSKPAALTPIAPKPLQSSPEAKSAPVTPAVKAYVLDSTAAKAAGFKLRGPDDLTVIEGIGPKINELFNTAGFHTFAQVAKMTEAQMQKILDDAGAKFRLAKPGTWAKQAAFANDNKWTELKTMQENLKGGV